MGGGYALQLAIAAPALKAVAINYGSLATDKTALAQIHAAVLGNFGGQDHGIPPESVHAFEAAMQSLGKPVDAKIYPQAGHAFENPNNATGYRADDAADALARVDRFFAAEPGPLKIPSHGAHHCGAAPIIALAFSSPRMLTLKPIIF